MKENPRVLTVLSVLFLIVSVGAGVALINQPVDTQSQASNIASMTLSSTQTSHPVGTRFVVDVEIESINDPISFIESTIRYDPQVLQLISQDIGSFFPKDSEYSFDQDNGIARFTQTLPGSTVPKTGAGSVVSIIFERQSDLPTTIEVDSASKASIGEDGANVVQLYGDLLLRSN